MKNEEHGLSRELSPEITGGDGTLPVPSRPHVFLDCDGVLADFDTYAEDYFGMNPRDYEKKVGSTEFWRRLEEKGDFYRNLPLMPDARELFEAVKHLHPTILTGCPRGTWAQGQKVAWAAEHFPGVPIITCRSADKRDYAKPGDVLIDDWPQHRHRWIEMGGVFIVHHDAGTSLAALWAHYPDLASDGVGRAPRPPVNPDAVPGTDPNETDWKARCEAAEQALGEIEALPDAYQRPHTLHTARLLVSAMQAKAFGILALNPTPQGGKPAQQASDE